MTMKFPALAVLMELAAFMKKELIKAQVVWSPRSGNSEAVVGIALFVHPLPRASARQKSDLSRMRGVCRQLTV